MVYYKIDLADIEMRPENYEYFFTKKSVFSNHYPCAFVIDGISFQLYGAILFLP